MNITALSNGSALSRVRGDDGGGVFGQVGAVLRPAASMPAPPSDALRAVSGNRIPPPGEGGKIEQPKALAANRMEQVQADLPQDAAMSAIEAMLEKFSEAQGMTR